MYIVACHISGVVLCNVVGVLLGLWAFDFDGC